MSGRRPLGPGRYRQAAWLALRYGLPCAAVGLFAVLRLVLQPLLDGDGPFLAFMVPVALSAYVGGSGPGALATLLSALAVWAPLPVPPLSDPRPPALLVLFLCEASAIVWLFRRLRTTNDRLVDALTVAERARAEAEAAVRSRQDLVARVSHEWRSPVTALTGWAWQLERRADQPEFVRRAAASMRRAVDTQSRLLADLLDHSRGVHGKLALNLEGVVLADVIRAAAEDLSTTASRKRVSLELSAQAACDARVRGDRVRLTQVFVNLLQNAIKYTPSGGHVAVSCEPRGDGIEVSVRDTGVGIPASALGTIFDAFAQTDQRRDAGRGGLGLGLSIVRELVHLHGGSVSAYSDGPSTGSTFVVRLPILATEPDRNSASAGRA